MIFFAFFPRRCPDIDGRWKVVAKEGECGFLDACGEPEPMKVNHIIVIIIIVVNVIIIIILLIINVIRSQSEIMASRDCYEMKRLDYGKVSLCQRHQLNHQYHHHYHLHHQVLLQTNSKFLPVELTMKADEHWQAELPDLGKVLGIMTEMKRSLMIVFKLDMKTITIRLNIDGDFLV